MAAYGFTALVVGALLLWTLMRSRQTARALAALESKLKRSD
jgi:heme exporter protein CcmD